MGEVGDVGTLWAQLVVLGGMSLSHMSMPNHWAPYSLVGRANNWTLRYTLLITFLGALGHVTTTVTAIAVVSGLSGSLISHEAYAYVSSGVLVVLGSYYIWSYMSGTTSYVGMRCCEGGVKSAGQGGNEGGSNGDGREEEEKETKAMGRDNMVSDAGAASLITMTSLSPCVGSIPILSAIVAGPVSFGRIVCAWGVLVATASVTMCTLVGVSFVGAKRVNGSGVRRHERLMMGIGLIAVGLLTALVFSKHEDHGAGHHGEHGHHRHGVGSMDKDGISDRSFTASDGGDAGVVGHEEVHQGHGCHDGHGYKNGVK